MIMPTNREIFWKVFKDNFIVLLIPFLALFGTQSVWKTSLFLKTTGCVWFFLLVFGFFMERKKILLQIEVAELRRLLNKESK